MLIQSSIEKGSKENKVIKNVTTKLEKATKFCGTNN